MKRIFKYELCITDRQVFNLAEGAEILSVQEQKGTGLCLWALVDPTAQKTDRITVDIVGTGNPVPDDVGTYLTTVQCADGRLVWHIFISRK